MSSKKRNPNQSTDDHQDRAREKLLHGLRGRHRRHMFEAGYLETDLPPTVLSDLESKSIQDLIGHVLPCEADEDEDKEEAELTPEQERHMTRIRAMSPEKRERLRILSTALLEAVKSFEDGEKKMDG